MRITEKTWIEYITRLAKINETAGQKVAVYLARHGTQDTDALIAYAQALVQKYGEGSAELACQMYDAMAEASGADVPPAVPAEPADYNETAKMVNATKQSPPQLQGGVSRLVKEKCDMIASIPMKGDIDSLNASVATGVLAYEIVRQRLAKA